MADENPIAWFREQLKLVGTTKDPFVKTGVPTVGNMYLFVYDPKHKATLPFYDMYPLAIPINYTNDGFLGLNLHYLPPGGRSALLGALISIQNNDKYNDSIKLNISYDLLKGASSKFSGFEQCVKRYIFGHVMSSYHYVQPSDWNKIVGMPLQRWKVNSNPKLAGSPPY